MTKLGKRLTCETNAGFFLKTWRHSFLTKKTMGTALWLILSLKVAAPPYTDHILFPFHLD